MRLMTATALVLAMGGQAAAIECPVSHAIYEQPGGQVVLRFSVVPPAAPANQIAYFSLRIDGVDGRLDGAIHVPNGYGQPTGSIGLDCHGAGDASCWLWEGVVYALGDSGIVEYPWDPDLPVDQQMAPQQLLLPELAPTLWYSKLRETAFAGDRQVLDTFTLAACAK